MWSSALRCKSLVISKVQVLELLVEGPLNGNFSIARSLSSTLINVQILANGFWPVLFSLLIGGANLCPRANTFSLGHHKSRRITMTNRSMCPVMNSLPSEDGGQHPGAGPSRLNSSMLDLREVDVSFVGQGLFGVF
ncbi:hypothetical protein RRG08_053588 [Elysia crispata]|uniref:Uncharacterized protein n=1 Tax=Elysia crispata TaxID=231223 RepID=A0AAE0Y2R4_9GAST|nr:hypothetical protein RRG08_053588 [Elysia crispata]